MTGRRRKIAGGIAALSLAAGLIVAGSLAAQAVPVSITIDTASPQAVGAGPHTVFGDITWNDVAGGILTVTVSNSNGTSTPCFEDAYTGAITTSWTCIVTPNLAYGANTITATADDGAGQLTSSSVVIVYGGTAPAAITSPGDGASSTVLPTFSGTGAPMGTVTLQARPFGSADPFFDICALTPVDASGTWSCNASFPERRIWTVQAQGQVLTGGDYGGPATQTFVFAPGYPDTQPVIEYGYLRLDAGPAPEGSTASTLWTHYANSADGGSPAISCGPAASIACEIPAQPVAGLYVATSRTQVNDAESLDRRDFVRVPAAPVITTADDSVGGQLTLTGTFDPTFSTPFAEVTGDGTPVIDVFNVDSEELLCSAVVPDAFGDWTCSTPAPPGAFDYVAYARTSTPIGTDTSADAFHASLSALSNVVSTNVPPLPLEILIPAEGDRLPYESDPFVISGYSELPGVDVNVTMENTTGYSAGCTATPDVDGTWACNVPSFPPPPAANYTVTATQVGSPDHVVQFTRTLPLPGWSGPTSFSIEVGSPPISLGGQNMYAGTTTIAFLPDNGPWCEFEDQFDMGFWSCDLDLSALPVGDWDVYLQNYDPDDATLYSELVELTISTTDPTGGTGTPTLNCAFTPNGGVTVTSPHVLEAFYLDAVYLEGGSDAPGNAFGLQGECNGSTGTPFPDDDGSLILDEIQACTTSCSQPSLDPGIYSIYYRVDDGDTSGVSFETHNYLFTIPEAPTITTAASTELSVILSGIATPSDTVRIVRPNGTQLCSATANGAGNWACQFPKSSTASARAISIDPSSGGMSAYSAARTIPVSATPTVTPFSLIAWFLEFGADLTKLKPGDTFSITISGMPEGTEIEVWMHSDPYLLGTATGTGSPLVLNLKVPDDIEAGAHTIEMIAVTPEGEIITSTNEVTVEPLPVADKPLDTDPLDDDDSLGGSGTGVGGSAGEQRGDAAAPSSITGTIVELQTVLANPAAIALAGGLALALLFLVALPSELLNSSLSSNTSRLGRVYGAVDRAITRAQDWLIEKMRARAVVALLIVVAVSVTYGFVDPHFGFDLVSLRLVLSLAIAFFLLSFVASWLSGLVIRRAWGAIGIVSLKPSIILFAVVGVIVARLLDFSPGFMIGVAIALELLEASRRVEARAIFVQLGIVTGFAVAAWVAYSLFTPGDDFLGMLIDDTLVATTTEGLTSALVAAFPLKFLEGRKLWENSKPLWAAAFLVVATAFALLVLPTAMAGTSVGDIVVWLIVFTSFAAITIAVWFFFVRADQDTEAGEKKERERVGA